MKTIKEFIEENNITLTAQSVPENPQMNSDTKMNHWFVTLKHGDKEMTIYFSMGEGLVEKRGKYINSINKTVGNWKRAPMPPRPKTLYDRDMIEKLYRPARPTIEEVLDCLASDSSGIENAPCFEDWAADYGYDTDSRKAEKTFQTCRIQADRLKAFMGDKYDELLWETERE